MAVLAEWRAAIERACQVPMNFYTAGVALLWTTAMGLGAPGSARPRTAEAAPQSAVDPLAAEGGSPPGEARTERAHGCNQPPILSRHLIKVQLR